METKRNKAIIIGGGLGGLFTGAILAKEGWEVEVLEKNRAIGGGLQSFRRWGMSFDTGMHMLVGFEPGGNLDKICSYLGVLDRIEMRKVDDDCADEITCAATGKTYRVAQGKEAFIESLAKEFPEESENLKRYVDHVYAITDQVGLFYLRPYDYDSWQMIGDDFTIPADEFIAMYIKDKHLRDLLSLRSPLFDGRVGETPAYVHAIINTLYIDGARRFVGPSQQLADALAEVIEENGGKVLAGAEVKEVEVEGKRITAVVTADGERHTADAYISAIHVGSMLDLMPEHAFTKAYRKRIDAIPNTCSAFTIFIKLKPDTIPYINHTTYVKRHDESVFDLGGPQDWPQGLMYMTPAQPGQCEWADRMVITAPMTWDQIAPWENTKHGHRGDDYLKWKDEHTRRLIDLACVSLPNLREAIAEVEGSSPLTVRDYYGAREGAIYGYRKDCRDIMLSHIAPVTKVQNLYYTGQCLNLHGICGVPLTAIVTAEILLGRNYVINKINKHYEETAAKA